MSKRKKPNSVSYYKKKADAVFSKWIRERDNYRCITCNGEANQAGHYFSRRYTYLRYDETNVNAQCVSCNVFKHGNIPIYRLRLVVKYGNEEVERLEKTYNIEKRYTVNELKEIIEKYK